ncbi:uncharacterized protein LOC128953108 [Oppia nitens]|uniref:uncharacterized protein LOC128953108 n=1 Tax=Oppia nitens TaxID=1686743 RepID=UPI0023DC24CF|nr:uncharacterized protein LOC128953108 [Oppia nitens]
MESTLDQLEASLTDISLTYTSQSLMEYNVTPSNRRRLMETPEERAQRTQAIRLNETQKERHQRIESNRQRVTDSRLNETQEERHQRIESNRQRITNSRLNETQKERHQRIESNRQRVTDSRLNETHEERHQRIIGDNRRITERRTNETQQERVQRIETERQRITERLNNETQEERQNSQHQREDDRNRHHNQYHQLGRFYKSFRGNARPERNDFDRMDRKCQHCGSMFWVIEKTHGSKNEPKYSKCCKKGLIILPPFQQIPDELNILMTNPNYRHQFLSNIRAYNSNFSFVSVGAKVEEPTRDGLCAFKIQGNMYHRMGSVLPQPGASPRFMQLYFYDTEHELNNRMTVMNGRNQNIVNILIPMMRENNPYVNNLKMTIDQLDNNVSQDIDIRILAEGPSIDRRTYNAPTASDFAAIIPQENCNCPLDIKIKLKSDEVQHINHNHRSFDALVYALLFPKGDFGWHFSVKSLNTAHTKKVTAMQYYNYVLHYRTNSHIHRCRRLYQQFAVDSWVKIESSRLSWIRFNQQQLRASDYRHIRDAIDNDIPTNNIGKYTQFYRQPSLFITFTCNPKWLEITRELGIGETANDRQDLIVRIFQQKCKELDEDLRKRHKRGLPHQHGIYWLDEADKLRNVEDYNTVVCTEIPSDDVILKETITKCMIHGPCGPAYPSSPCMKDNKCSKGYPMAFVDKTYLNKKGFVKYQRRNDGQVVNIRSQDTVSADNQFIVPYNRGLSRNYNAHINVEVCSTIQSCKYLFKYTHKGKDNAMAGLSEQNSGNDEIKLYQDSRWVSTTESLWHIFGYGMHSNTPAVYRLPVHLENRQIITFRGTTEVDQLTIPKETELTRWMAFNNNSSEGRHLLYPEFSQHYTFQNNHWKKRCRQQLTPIGRIYTVHPSEGELYYFRLLLFHISRAKSYQDMRTAKGQVCATFKSTAEALGLLEQDKEWDLCLNEAIITQSGKQIRELFATILVFGQPTSPKSLWEKYKTSMTEDYVRDQQRRHDEDYEITEQIINIFINNALKDIQSHLEANSKFLSDFPEMPTVNNNLINGTSRLILDEIEDNPELIRPEVEINEKLLNEDQKKAYLEIINAVNSNAENSFFSTLLVVEQPIHDSKSPFQLMNLRAAGFRAKAIQPNLYKKHYQLSNTEQQAIRSIPVSLDSTSDFLLSIKESRSPYNEEFIDLPEAICSKSMSLEDFLNELPSINDWTIVAAKNDHVDEINNILIDKFEGDEIEYFSANSLVEKDKHGQFTDEFLASLHFSGLPSHKLILKKDYPVMLLRNINPSIGLCNGTTLICKEFHRLSIVAEIKKGKNQGRQVVIPRIDLIPSDTDLPFLFKRRQFKIKPAFAMTINKSQG